MTKAKKRWYVKERYNPQLGDYYVPSGEMTRKEAKEFEKPLYGSNVMHGLATRPVGRSGLGRAWRRLFRR